MRACCSMKRVGPSPPTSAERVDDPVGDVLFRVAEVLAAVVVLDDEDVVETFLAGEPACLVVPPVPCELDEFF